jgi:virginiamycin B lyase
MSQESVEVVRRGASVRRVALLLAALLAVTLTLALAPRTEAFVYWADPFGGTIGRANLDGTGVDQRFITGAPGQPGRSFLGGLAVDAAHVYWLRYEADLDTFSIARANLDGTGVEPNFIRSGIMDFGPDALAVDTEHVYWVNRRNDTIGRANLDGTGLEPNFITLAGIANGVVVDAQHVYWTSYNGGIGRANLDGTGVDPNFIETLFASGGVAVDAARIYWATLQSIGRANIDGTSAEQSFITPAGNPSSVAVDPAHVYWTDENGKIGRANLDGTGVEPSLINTGPFPGGIAVDALRSFSFGKVKRNKEKGTARLTLKVPGPGELELANTTEVKGRRSAPRRRASRSCR